ncbi:hypothetical protein J6N69_03940 [bacterium]|nr:hypothetical protein [bacterium]
MATNRIAEGVGKKIVEALKQQSEMEIQNVVESPAQINEPSFEEEPIQYNYEDDNYTDNNIEYQQPANQNIMTFSQPQVNISSNSFASDLDDAEIPNNVAVLKQLIGQLPAGVSRQIGAQIIKQTMEALGISMKNVLQEAQQVQENINNSTRDCQASIIEHKKQINQLEQQSLKLQRQYSAINEIISLFVQTSL